VFQRDTRSRRTLDFLCGRRPDFRHCCVLFFLRSGLFSDNNLKKTVSLCRPMNSAAGLHQVISVTSAYAQAKWSSNAPTAQSKREVLLGARNRVNDRQG
jgi:hypothetical protein